MMCNESFEAGGFVVVDCWNVSGETGFVCGLEVGARLGTGTRVLDLDQRFRPSTRAGVSWMKVRSKTHGRAAGGILTGWFGSGCSSRTPLDTLMGLGGLLG